MFQQDSTVWFSREGRFSESCSMQCPVCGNLSIKVTIGEDGSRNETCAVCERAADMTAGRQSLRHGIPRLLPGEECR